MCYYLAENTNVLVSAGGWLGLLGFRGLGRVHQVVTLRHGRDEITMAGEKGGGRGKETMTWLPLQKLLGNPFICLMVQFFLFSFEDIK